MVIFGGIAGVTRELDDLYILDLETKIWKQLAESTQIRKT
jgi:hypothetical protein